MEIERGKYLQDLINRMNNHMIKVVTGVRRSGNELYGRGYVVNVGIVVCICLHRRGIL